MDLLVVSRGSTVRHPIITKLRRMSEVGRVTVKLGQLSDYGWFFSQSNSTTIGAGIKSAISSTEVRWLYHCATAPRLSSDLAIIIKNQFVNIIFSMIYLLKVHQYSNNKRTEVTLHIFAFYSNWIQNHTCHQRRKNITFFYTLLEKYFAYPKFKN